jgi:ribosome-associated heat shock protein Hsp15
MAAQQDNSGKVRLDKWLWAARFFKTRSMAKQAIDSGKVHCNGARSKSSRDVETGMILEIRQGWDERTVVVKALSDKRGGAPQAALLYEETPESIAKREFEAEKRKAQRAMNPITAGRPTKQDRRKIHRFKQQQLEE